MNSVILKVSEFFIGMLVAAVLIGVYYAIKDRKPTKQNLDNYNYGGRSMSAVSDAQ